MASESTDPSKARPILKWAGGKRQLLPEILPLLPETIETYYEPFAGGLALFWELANQKRFKQAVISDVNPELVNLYKVTRDHGVELEQALRLLSEQHYGYLQDGKGEEHYLRVRDWDGTPMPGVPFEPEVERAARTVFLNKTGFNGLYRTNSKGKSNVPYGKNPKPNIYDYEALRAARNALQDVQIRQGDFFSVTCNAERGDVVYLDPPYLPVSQTSSFSGYVYNAFAMPDQMRLAKEFTDLGRRGVVAILSNSHTPETVALFGPPHDLRIVQAKRSINSDSEKRGVVGEILSVARRSDAL